MYRGILTDTLTAVSNDYSEGNSSSEVTATEVRRARNTTSMGNGVNEMITHPNVSSKIVCFSFVFKMHRFLQENIKMVIIINSNFIPLSPSNSSKTRNRQ